MKRQTVAAFGALIAALVTTGFGCELITAPDRSQITGSGGTGGTPTTSGGGGVGGQPTTGGSGGSGGSGGTGGGTPCTDVAQCPAAAECFEATCENDVCGTKPLAVGTAVADQTAGDCKVAQCDGAGAVEEANDDADLPVDGEDCTDDVCTAGVASNPAKVADTPCGLNLGLVCNGAGQCVGCTTATQCGADTECQTQTCVGNVCGSMNEAQGKALLDQTDGDCKVDQCDGNGGTETADDNGDVPVDATTCTNDICAAGMPSNPPVAASTVCSEGNGTLCDGNGACVACIAATDCPGVDDECQTRTCIAGACGVSFAMNGTAVASQTTNDCKKNVCDGAGAIVSANDDLDLPNDNNDCTGDSCSMGAEVHTPVMVGTSCGAAGLCNAAGQCVGCNTAADCPGADDECKTRTCNANVCGLSFTADGTAVAAQSANDCKKNVCDGSGNIVNQNDDADLPVDDGQQCTNEVCAAGVPSHPAKALDTSCNQNGGTVCSAAGSCVACNSATQCPGSDTECQVRTCSANACGVSFQPNGFQTPTQVGGDCKIRQCDGAGSFLQADANGDVPADDGEQCTDEVCTAGVPSHPAKMINTACNQNGGTLCSAVGTCVQCNVATTCPGTDTECQTRTCNANACGLSFAAPGTPAATQTAGDCQENQCNGAGGIAGVAQNADVPVDNNQCTGDVCTAGAPSNPALVAGTACSENGGTVCDGAGMCIASAGCSDNMKNGDETDVDCGGSCPKCDDLLACMVANDCQSGVCTVNVCQEPTCSDGVANGDETGFDCGGPCVGCPNAQPCGVNGDCQSNICSNNVCVECVSAATCPGTDTECQTRTCNGNACGFSFAASGTAVAAQTTGDCQQNVCNGAGAVVSAANNADVPADDGQQCTDDVCVAGAPAHPAKTADTACSQNGGIVCSAVGTCVECNSAAQCPGTDTDCQVRTCTANACGVSNTAPGTVTATQTTGDCQQNECNGAGGIVSVAQNADVPADDGNQCTDDVCTAGAPAHPFKAEGTACSQNGGTVCDAAGTCVAPAVAPEVAMTTPADGATGVAAATATIAVTFTKMMNPATLTGQTAAGACSGSIQVSLDNFTSCLAFSSAAATMSGGNTIATLTPAPALAFGTIYKIRVTTAAADAGGLALAATFTQPTGFGTGTDAVYAPGVVISQVYANGGNSGATYNADFVELHNRGTVVANIGGWSVQYASATGLFGNGTQRATLPAVVTLQPGQYYLVRLSTPSAVNGVALIHDHAAAPQVVLGGGGGKVALVNVSTLLPTVACPGGNATIVDFVGYGSQVEATGCWETHPAGGTAPAQVATTSVQRKLSGCQDSADNSADFETLAVSPRNTATPAFTCSVSVNEQNVSQELDFCNVQFPTSIAVQTGMQTPIIYARAYEAGVTDPAGAAANLVAQIGYGPTTVNPENQSGWTWTPATFNIDVGNNDEWQAQLTAPAAGSYLYGSRFSFDGAQWTYCDLNGAGSNAGLTFEVAQLPTLTVTP